MDQLPNDAESEMQVLGSLLLSPGLYPEIAAIVGSEDFYRSRHRLAWDLLETLHAEGTPVDPITFNQRLPFRNEEPLFVTDLLGAVTAASAGPYHAKRVRDAARLRFLALAGRDISEAACAPDAKLDVVLTEAEHAVFHASRNVRDGLSWDEALIATVDRIEHHHQTGSTMDGLETGLHALDNLLGGLQPGWLVYIGARPGIGKTALALQTAVDVAQRGLPVTIFSLEMSTEELARRAICRIAGISYSRVRHNQMTEKDWSKFVQAQTTLAGLPLHVYDNEVETVPAIASRVRQLRPALVIVDYVQLLKHPKARSRAEEVGEVSRSLKLLARETRIPIVAPAQLNRQPEGREHKRPNLSDLRESGSLEQDADAVMFLSRKDDDGTTTYLDLAKFRHGPVGTATLGWDPTVTKFYDLY